MDYKLISFYADIDGSNFYSSSGKRMIHRCKRLGIDHHIVELKSQRNYFKNTLMKPQFILDCLKKFNQPVLWVDVDSIIHRKPVLDDALLSHDISGVDRGTSSDNKIFEHDIFVSPLYFNTTQKSFDFLNKWIEDCKNPDMNYEGDHSPFLYLLHEMDIKIDHFLPPSLSWNRKFDSSKSVNRKDIIIETVLAPPTRLRSKNYKKIAANRGHVSASESIARLKKDQKVLDAIKKQNG